MTSRSRLGLRAAIGIGLLLPILARIDRREVVPDPSWPLGLGLLTAAALLLASQGLAAYRWKLILGRSDLPWRYLARLYVIAAFFNLLLPTAVGGDAVRAAAATDGAPRPGAVLTSVVVDRLFGVAALLLYAGLGLALSGGIPAPLGRSIAWRYSPAALAVGVAVLAVVGWTARYLVRRSGRLAVLVDQGIGLAGDLLRRPAAVLGALLVALAVQGLVIALWVVLARGLGLGLPVITFLVAVPLVTLGSMLPITISGLGVREGLWLFLLGGGELASGRIVGFSLLYFVTTMVVGLIGLLLFVTVGVGRPPAATDRLSTRPEKL